jgi:hypothetical protein
MSGRLIGTAVKEDPDRSSGEQNSDQRAQRSLNP